MTSCAENESVIVKVYFSCLRLHPVYSESTVNSLSQNSKHLKYYSTIQSINYNRSLEIREVIIFNRIVINNHIL